VTAPAVLPAIRTRGGAPAGTRTCRGAVDQVKKSPLPEQRELTDRTSDQIQIMSAEGKASMTSESLHSAQGPARRTVVAAVGAAGLAVALTACGSDDKDSGTAGAGNAAGTELAKTSDIPEGGGKVFADKGVVVTQPTAGTFKAFSSKCTHQGCAVKGIANGVIT